MFTDARAPTAKTARQPGRDARTGRRRAFADKVFGCLYLDHDVLSVIPTRFDVIRGL